MKTQNFFIAILLGNLVFAFSLLAYMYNRYTPATGKIAAPTITTPSTPKVATTPAVAQPQALPLMCYEAQIDNPATKTLVLSALEQQKATGIEQKTAPQISKHQVYWGLGTTPEIAQAKLNELKAKGVFQTPNIQLILVNKQYALNISTVSTKEEAQSQVSDMSKKAVDFGGVWFTEPLQITPSYVNFQLTAAALGELQQKVPTATFQKCSN